MTDNPFNRPGDANRTVIQPNPGGRPAPPSARPDDGNRTIIKPNPGGRPATPAAATDESNRTIIKPNPGRRQPDPAPAPLPPPPPASSPAASETPRGAEREAPAARSIATAVDTKNIAIGEDALASVAAPLLQLMARLHNTVNPPDAGDLREWTVRQVRIFEQEASDRGVASEQLRPAHYALCVSLDDVVLNTPWGSRGTWSARPLVSTFHPDAGGEERFFEVLRQMCNNPGKFLPVIKLMYLCLSLGFIGRYRQAGRGAGDIRRIREELYAVIVRQQKQAEPELAPHARGIQAPYRRTRIRLPLWVAASAGLGIVAGVFAWAALTVNADSDAVYARARDVPPAQMPTIARGPIVETQPVAAPVPSPEPTALSRLQGSLQPEIAQGLVEVIGTAAQPLVRVPGRGMFASGSAALQPGFKPLLDRIGQALKGETGRVRVIGYTDDQSIRTMAFPSNAQLSAARAQAASAIIAAGLGDAARVSSEGRADAEPIASNATPEGRERNRRIEIVLTGQGP